MNLIMKTMPSIEVESKKSQHMQRSKNMSQTDKTVSREIK